MKGFAIPLLGVIFVTLISGSIQSIYADHLEPDQGIFSSEDEDSNESTNSKYFSRINNFTREALNFINNLKFHKKWKITYKTSLIT